MRVLAELLDIGLVKLEGAFDADDAVAMRAAFWGEAGRRYGATEHDATTWPAGPIPRLYGSKRHPAFDAMATPRLGAAVDEVLGAGTWAWPGNWGQVLATFPSPQPWQLPSNLWHLDHAFGEAVDPMPAVHVFACFGSVVHRGGGTLVVAGSHHLVARFVADRPEITARPMAQARQAFHATFPWLRALSDGSDGSPDRWERFSAPAEVDGITLRVVEMTGEPGDVWLMHPKLLHHTSTNASTQPRLVRHQAIRRATAP